MDRSPLSLALSLGLAGMCLVLALAMALSLLRRGDERRRLILSRTAACSFWPALVLLAGEGALSLLGIRSPLAPFLSLCVLLLFFSGALAYYSRKYGD